MTDFAPATQKAPMQVCSVLTLTQWTLGGHSPRTDSRHPAAYHLLPLLESLRALPYPKGPTLLLNGKHGIT